MARRNQTYSQYPTHAARVAHAKGEKQFKTYDTSHIRPKRSVGPTIFAIIIVLLVVAALAFFGSKVIGGEITDIDSFINFVKNEQGAELLPEGEEVVVTIPEGSTTTEIGDILKEAGLIEKTNDFKSRVKALGVDGQLRPGNYLLTGGMEVDDIISLLTQGPNTLDLITIPEGFTLNAIGSRVEEYTEGRIAATDFQWQASNASWYANDFPFLADAGENSLEGFLFPKSYEFAAEEDSNALCRKMLSQFQTETAGLDYSYPESVGLNAYQTLILASIIEKEASPETRTRVAAVFYNRLLDAGETAGYLQSDATTAYVVGHDPTPDEVHADDPYSTYTKKGLPPTPICNPGIESLRAACNPDAATLEEGYCYFFFYTDADGVMQYVFSKTYEEHQQVIADVKAAQEAAAAGGE